MKTLTREINYTRIIAFDIFMLFQIYLQLTIPGPYSKGLIVLCMIFFLAYNYFQFGHKRVMYIYAADLYIYSIHRKHKIRINSIHSIDLNHRFLNRLLNINTVYIHFIDGRSRKIYVPDFDRDKAAQFIKEHIIYQ